MSDVALEVNDLTVKFAGVTALSSVTFSVTSGQIHALIGPNGAGKSSCFNVISGIYRPAHGSVLVNGRPVIGWSPHRIAALGIGRAFQHPALDLDETVEENLLLGRHRLTRAGVLGGGLRLRRSRREDRTSRQHVRETAELLGITRHLGTPAGQLSYGEQKRVDIGRAMCADPKLLLLDEPVAGLNAAETYEIGQLIRTVRDDFGSTVLFVEHDMTMVMSIADRITVLDFGVVIAQGSPGTIRANPDVIRAYLGETDDPVIHPTGVTS